MKTKLVVFLAVCVVIKGNGEGLADSNAVAAGAPTKAVAPAVGAPRIQFAETEFDFGKISSGDIVRHDFIFTNTGTAALAVTDVRPGCGCTTVGSWDKAVAPGASGMIPLQFNSTGFGGAVDKAANIICNDPSHSNVVLRLKGTIWRPIEVIPNVVLFNVSSDSQSNETQIVRVLNNQEEAVELSDLQCTNHAFEAELRTVRPGREFELAITAVPPFYSDQVVGIVTLKTTSAKMPTLQVNAFMSVRKPITVFPEQITLPPGPLAATMSVTVSVRNNGTNSLSLSDAAVNYPEVDVRLQERQAGRFFSLMLKLPAGFQVKTGERIQLSMKSNHPRYPVIEVPIVQPGPVALPAVPAGKLLPGDGSYITPPPVRSRQGDPAR